MTRARKSFSIGRTLRAGLPPLLTMSAAAGLGAYALFGPSGLIALGDHKAALSERKAELARLEAEHAALENRVRLLRPDQLDPDLGGELIRKELGVVAPDEIVIPLD